MKKTIIMTGAVCATLLLTAPALWVAPAHALTNCTATLRPTDSAILVGAKGVSGTLLWGNSAGTETNAFSNAATCVTGSPLVAKKCQLGATGSAQAITPPPLCTVYLKDGAGTCSAFIKKCTPGVRGAFSEPTCGNGVAEVGEACDGADLNGKTCVSQGFLSGTLACTGSCALDTSDCSNDRFVDNGDGTITDNQTQLMWEKKTGTVGTPADCLTAPCSIDPHDVNSRYTWSTGAPYDPNGTAFFVFLSQLNEYGAHFAGHGDWRLPTHEEGVSIVDTTYGACNGGPPTAPCINPIFEPVQFWGYASSVTLSTDPSYEWDFWFNGYIGSDFKTGPAYVRAVRSLR